MTPKRWTHYAEAVRVALDERTADARRARRRRHRAARAAPYRRMAPLGLGHAAEAARMARRPLLRTEPGKPRDLHAPRGRELALDRTSRSGRGGARPRSPPISAPTGRRRSRPSATGWPGLFRQAPAPRLVPRSSSSWSRSRWTASVPTSWPRTSTSWPRRRRPNRPAAARASTSTSGSRHRRTVTSCRLATCRGELAERLDLTCRVGRRRRVRDLGARRRAGGSGLVRGSRKSAPEGSAGGGRTALVDPGSRPAFSDQPTYHSDPEPLAPYAPTGRRPGPDSTDDFDRAESLSCRKPNRSRPRARTIWKKGSELSMETFILFSGETDEAL